MFKFYYLTIIQTQKAPLFGNSRKARGPIFYARAASKKRRFRAISRDLVTLCGNMRGSKVMAHIPAGNIFQL